MCMQTYSCVFCFRYLIIENFIPPEEKNKIMNRLTFDPEEDQWKFQPLVPADRSVCDPLTLVTLLLLLLALLSLTCYPPDRVQVVSTRILSLMYVPFSF